MKKYNAILSPGIVPSTTICIFLLKGMQELGLTEGTEDWYFPSFAYFGDLVFESKSCLNHDPYLNLFALPSYVYFPALQSHWLGLAA